MRRTRPGFIFHVVFPADFLAPQDRTAKEDENADINGLASRALAGALNRREAQAGVPPTQLALTFLDPGKLT
jgi:hypothetical protein